MSSSFRRKNIPPSRPSQSTASLLAACYPTSTPTRSSSHAHPPVANPDRLVDINQEYFQIPTTSSQSNTSAAVEHVSSVVSSLPRMDMPATPSSLAMALTRASKYWSDAAIALTSSCSRAGASPIKLPPHLQRNSAQGSATCTSTLNDPLPPSHSTLTAFSRAFHSAKLLTCHHHSRMHVHADRNSPFFSDSTTPLSSRIIASSSRDNRDTNGNSGQSYGVSGAANGLGGYGDGGTRMAEGAQPRASVTYINQDGDRSVLKHSSSGGEGRGGVARVVAEAIRVLFGPALPSLSSHLPPPTILSQSRSSEVNIMKITEEAARDEVSVERPPRELKAADRGATMPVTMSASIPATRTAMPATVASDRVVGRKMDHMSNESGKGTGSGNDMSYDKGMWLRQLWVSDLDQFPKFSTFLTNFPESNAPNPSIPQFSRRLRFTSDSGILQESFCDCFSQFDNPDVVSPSEKNLFGDVGFRVCACWRVDIATYMSVLVDISYAVHMLASSDINEDDLLLLLRYCEDELEKDRVTESQRQSEMRMKTPTSTSEKNRHDENKPTMRSSDEAKAEAKAEKHAQEEEDAAKEAENETEQEANEDVTVPVRGVLNAIARVWGVEGVVPSAINTLAYTSNSTTTQPHSNTNSNITSANTAPTNSSANMSLGTVDGADGAGGAGNDGSPAHLPSSPTCSSSSSSSKSYSAPTLGSCHYLLAPSLILSAGRPLPSVPLLRAVLALRHTQISTLASTHAVAAAEPGAGSYLHAYAKIKSDTRADSKATVGKGSPSSFSSISRLSPSILPVLSLLSAHRLLCAWTAWVLAFAAVTVQIGTKNLLPKPHGVKDTSIDATTVFTGKNLDSQSGKNIFPDSSPWIPILSLSAFTSSLVHNNRHTHVYATPHPPQSSHGYLPYTPSFSFPPSFSPLFIPSLSLALRAVTVIPLTLTLRLDPCLVVPTKTKTQTCTLCVDPSPSTMVHMPTDTSIRTQTHTQSRTGTRTPALDLVQADSAQPASARSVDSKHAHGSAAALTSTSTSTSASCTSCAPGLLAMCTTSPEKDQFSGNIDFPEFSLISQAPLLLDALCLPSSPLSTSSSRYLSPSPSLLSLSSTYIPTSTPACIPSSTATSTSHIPVPLSFAQLAALMPSCNNPTDSVMHIVAHATTDPDIGATRLNNIGTRGDGSGDDGISVDITNGTGMSAPDGIYSNSVIPSSFDDTREKTPKEITPILSLLSEMEHVLSTTRRLFTQSRTQTLASNAARTHTGILADILVGKNIGPYSKNVVDIAEQSIHGLFGLSHQLSGNLQKSGKKVFCESESIIPDLRNEILPPISITVQKRVELVPAKHSGKESGKDSEKDSGKLSEKHSQGKQQGKQWSRSTVVAVTIPAGPLTDNYRENDDSIFRNGSDINRHTVTSTSNTNTLPNDDKIDRSKKDKGHRGYSDDNGSSANNNSGNSSSGKDKSTEWLRSLLAQQTVQWLSLRKRWDSQEDRRVVEEQEDKEKTKEKTRRGKEYEKNKEKSEDGRQEMETPEEENKQRIEESRIKDKVSEKLNPEKSIFSEFESFFRMNLRLIVAIHGLWQHLLRLYHDRHISMDMLSLSQNLIQEYSRHIQCDSLYRENRYSKLLHVYATALRQLQQCPHQPCQQQYKQHKRQEQAPSLSYNAHLVTATTNTATSTVSYSEKTSNCRISGITNSGGNTPEGLFPDPVLPPWSTVQTIHYTHTHISISPEKDISENNTSSEFSLSKNFAMKIPDTLSGKSTNSLGLNSTVVVSTLDDTMHQSVDENVYHRDNKIDNRDDKVDELLLPVAEGNGNEKNKLQKGREGEKKREKETMKEEKETKKSDVEKSEVAIDKDVSIQTNIHTDIHNYTNINANAHVGVNTDMSIGTSISTPISSESLPATATAPLNHSRSSNNDSNSNNNAIDSRNNDSVADMTGKMTNFPTNSSITDAPLFSAPPDFPTYAGISGFPTNISGIPPSQPHISGNPANISGKMIVTSSSPSIFASTRITQTRALATSRDTSIPQSQQQQQQQQIPTETHMQEREHLQWLLARVAELEHAANVREQECKKTQDMHTRAISTLTTQIIEIQSQNERLQFENTKLSAIADKFAPLQQDFQRITSSLAQKEAEIAKKDEELSKYRRKWAQVKSKLEQRKHARKDEREGEDLQDGFD